MKNEFLSVEVSLFGIHGVRVAAIEGMRIDCNEEERRTYQVYTPLCSENLLLSHPSRHDPRLISIVPLGQWRWTITDVFTIM